MNNNKPTWNVLISVDGADAYVTEISAWSDREAMRRAADEILEYRPELADSDVHTVDAWQVARLGFTNA